MAVRRIPRPLARAPIWLFRLGLGGLFGGRLLMLEHRGRKSGQVRQVVLEVVAREGASRVVVSGHGWSAQWLRNVRADPRVRLWVGSRRGRSARAHVLEAAEAVMVLERYRRTHPAAALMLSRVLDLGDLGREEPLPADVAERLPVVRITPIS